MSRWSLLIFVAILVAITPWRTATAQSTPVAPPLSRPQPTALLVFTAQDPMWVPASDGKVHIVYDLVMTNIFSSPVTITSVEILTTDGVPLLHLAGDALLAATRPVFGDTPTQVVPTSGAIVTLVNVPLSADAVPERLTPLGADVEVLLSESMNPLRLSSLAFAVTMVASVKPRLTASVCAASASAYFVQTPRRILVLSLRDLLYTLPRSDNTA